MTGAKTTWYKTWLTTASVANLVGLGISDCDLGRKGVESNRTKTTATAARVPTDNKITGVTSKKKTEVVETTVTLDPAPSSKRAKRSEKKTKSKKTKLNSPGKSKVCYRNREEVKETGAAPLHKGDPGYGSELDRDGNGVACEK